MESKIFRNTGYVSLTTLLIRPLIAIVFLIFIIPKLSTYDLYIFLGLCLIGFAFIFLELYAAFLLFTNAASMVYIYDDRVSFKMLFRKEYTYNGEAIKRLDLIRLPEIFHFPLKIEMEDGKIFKLELTENLEFFKEIKRLNPNAKLSQRLVKKYY